MVVDHQTAKLLISGGVEILSPPTKLTLTKGQGHYPPFPGLFVFLIKGAGALPALLVESSGGAVFNWLWGPVRDQTVVLLLQMDRRSSGRSTTTLLRSVTSLAGVVIKSSQGQAQKQRDILPATWSEV